MDDARFDAVARLLGGASSRRGALAALAGVGVGVGLGLEAGPAAAVASGRKRRCRASSPPGQCCRKRRHAVECRCRNGGLACGQACCLPGQFCEAGQCVDAPPCTPTFPATNDPVENGKALKAAIAAAKDGATIVLESGRYELDPETHLEEFRTGLLIENRQLAITRCRPTDTVTLACPQLIGAPLHWVLACIWVDATERDTSLTLDGIDIDDASTDLTVIRVECTSEAERKPSSAFQIENSAIVTDALWGVAVVRATASARIGRNVSLARRDPSRWAGLYAYETTMTCDQPPAISGWAQRCLGQQGGAFAGCGCD